MLPSVLTKPDDPDLLASGTAVASPVPVVIGSDGSKNTVREWIWATGRRPEKRYLLRLVGPGRWGPSTIPIDACGPTER